MLAIIGGSNMQNTFGTVLEERFVSTPYASSPVRVERRQLDDSTCYFLSRHGRNHETVAHKVNYRANVWALKELGVDKVIAGATVGGIDPSLQNGTFLVPDQILDFTHGRALSFEQSNLEEHFDFTEPFTSELREILIQSARESEMEVKEEGTYVCAQGPRFETAAEIKFYEQIGGTVVGMTLMPEAALARQISLRYAAFCLVVNPAAGLVPDTIELDSTAAVSKHADEQLLNWLGRVIQRLK